MLILKRVKVLCFDTPSQVLVLENLHRSSKLENRNCDVKPTPLRKKRRYLADSKREFCGDISSPGVLGKEAARY